MEGTLSTLKFPSHVTMGMIYLEITQESVTPHITGMDKYQHAEVIKFRKWF